jgi:endoglucanase
VHLHFVKRAAFGVGLILLAACTQQADEELESSTDKFEPAKKAMSNSSQLQQVATASDANSALCLAERWWSNYKEHLISQDGRVIDRSDSRLITTSEGQSYALFFALMMNDKEAFELLLQWTQNNLAHGDLTIHLPAWLWGQTENNDWRIIDQNSATDSDMWIAYSLLEAGRLWKEPKYSAIGELIALMIIEKEAYVTESLGLVLLPGASGFVKPNRRFKLNPSYFPPMLTHYFATTLLGSRWPEVHRSSMQIIRNSSPRGIAPDWWWLNDTDLSIEQSSKQQPHNSANIGSYDAIRVYMWLGMLNKDFGSEGDATQNNVNQAMAIAQDKSSLIDHLGGMMPLISATGAPPEKINAQSAQATGTGNLSFRAALLPYVSHFDQQLAKKMALTVIAKYEEIDNDAYYSQSLIGFGLGWWQGWFEFMPSGALLANRGQCRQ